MSKTDYQIAKELGIIDSIFCKEEHHPNSVRLMKFLEEIDFSEFNDFFCWKSGGDGDNGEILMHQLDAFFDFLDNTNDKTM